MRTKAVTLGLTLALAVTAVVAGMTLQAHETGNLGIPVRAVTSISKRPKIPSATHPVRAPSRVKGSKIPRTSLTQASGKVSTNKRRKPPTTTTTTPIKTTTTTTLTTTTTTTPTTQPATSPLGPVTSLHYTPNANFDSNGNYLPGADGFNLADVSSTYYASHLPAGVKALVYVGLCSGADATFQATIRPYIGITNVFGFYLMDEPDPTGQYSSLCPPANLKAESDWIHANDPGAKTFIVVMNESATSSPSYANGYNPANSGIDLYGLDPYPCRTELASNCDYSWIGAGVKAAEASGIPQADIVPVYQAFGGGTWTDDGGGAYLMPSPSEETQILGAWAAAVPNSVFDYAYSWGSQLNDSSLSSDSSLQQIFAEHNG